MAVSYTHLGSGLFGEGNRLFEKPGGDMLPACLAGTLSTLQVGIFLQLHGVDVLPVGEHVDGLVLFPEDDLGHDPHPVVVRPVGGDHKVVLQALLPPAIGVDHVFGGKGVDVPLAKVLPYLLFRHDFQRLVVGGAGGGRPGFQSTVGSPGWPPGCG